MEKFLIANVRAEDLAEENDAKKYLLPKPTCPLYSADFINKIIKGKVVRVRRTIANEAYPDDGVSPGLLFAELLRVGIGLGHNFKEMRKQLGFDHKKLPNNGYMLGLLEYLDRDSPFIVALKSASREERYNSETLSRLALLKMRETGKVEKPGNDVFEDLKQFYPSLRSILTAANFVLYQEVKFKADAAAIIEAARSNPIVMKGIQGANMSLLAAAANIDPSELETTLPHAKARITEN